MTTSRRKFIKISALGLGSVAATTSAVNMFGANSYLDDLVTQNVSKKFKRTLLIAKFAFGNVQLGLTPMKTGRLKKLLEMTMIHIVMEDFAQEVLEVWECIMTRTDLKHL